MNHVNSLPYDIQILVARFIWGEHFYQKVRTNFTIICEYDLRVVQLVRDSIPTLFLSRQVRIKNTHRAIYMIDNPFRTDSDFFPLQNICPQNIFNEVFEHMVLLLKTETLKRMRTYRKVFMRNIDFLRDVNIKGWNYFLVRIFKHKHFLTDIESYQTDVWTDVIFIHTLIAALNKIKPLPFFL